MGRVILRSYSFEFIWMTVVDIGHIVDWMQHISEIGLELVWDECVYREVLHNGSHGVLCNVVWGLRCGYCVFCIYMSLVLGCHSSVAPKAPLLSALALLSQV